MTPISATGNRPSSSQRGFTITEVLIVMALIALATRAVVLALPNDHRLLREEVETFAARLKAAQDIAILSNRAVYSVITGFGYRFEERRADSWKQITSDVLKAADWAGETQVLLSGGGRTRIELGNLGGVSPMSFNFRRGSARLDVSLNYDGSIEIRDARD